MTTGSAGGRSAKSGAMPGMSELHIQAYLTARDAIRRIQRSASLFDAPTKQPGSGSESAPDRRDCH